MRPPRVRDWRAEYRKRDYGRAVCEHCGIEFTRHDPRVQRFCSPACGNASQEAPTRDHVLAILSRGRAVASAEIAGRLYGAADAWELHAVHTTVWRLRRMGYPIETVHRDGWRGYRLAAAEDEEIAS